MELEQHAKRSSAVPPRAWFAAMRRESESLNLRLQGIPCSALLKMISEEGGSYLLPSGPVAVSRQEAVKEWHTRRKISALITEAFPDIHDPCPF